MQCKFLEKKQKIKKQPCTKLQTCNANVSSIKPFLLLSSSSSSPLRFLKNGVRKFLFKAVNDEVLREKKATFNDDSINRSHKMKDRY